MILVVALSECSIRPMVVTGAEGETALCVLSHSVSIRQPGRKRQFTAETGCLDPWPQLLPVTDAAAVKPRVSSFMYDGCRNQFRA